MSERHPATGRVLAWTALIVALGASVAANAAYARPEAGPRLSAGTAPVLVVLAAGLLERVALDGAKWWQRWLAIGGLIFVILAAFATSYQHQRALLLKYGNPELSAALLPLAIDALIVMASICLSVIADRRRAQTAEVAPRAATQAATETARTGDSDNDMDDLPVATKLVAPRTALSLVAPVAPAVAPARRATRTTSATRKAARAATENRDRVIALHLADRDRLPSDIAREVGCDKRTVQRHIASVKNGHLAGSPEESEVIS